MNKSRGVILIAVGHPFYGNYAHNLAMSIKHVSPEVSISCVTDGVGMGHISKHVFDKIIHVPEEYINTKGLKDYLKTKVYLYDLSPYDDTIFIDADVIWTPKKNINTLFDSFADINFTVANHSCIAIAEAKKGFIHWADPKDIREKLKITEGTLYNLASEFIYFKKCKEVKKLFKIAQDFYENPSIDFMRFGHRMPDELAFEIAILKTKIYPHASPFLPFYWEHFEKKNWEPYKIYDHFYGFSIGGNITEVRAQNTYNNLGNAIAKKFGMRFFPCRNKNSFLPERSQI